MGNSFLMNWSASLIECCETSTQFSLLTVSSDYNTRFSGITASDVETAAMDLKAVRTAACAFIGPDTIVVGHG